uniref:Uncharacterized protein n=1 Tax=Romanomermis culicivorax TaxID=13658 RepID=A0A915KUD9_ROMCU
MIKGKAKEEKGNNTQLKPKLVLIGSILLNTIGANVCSRDTGGEAKISNSRNVPKTSVDLVAASKDNPLAKKISVENPMITETPLNIWTVRAIAAIANALTGARRKSCKAFFSDNFSFRFRFSTNKESNNSKDLRPRFSSLADKMRARGDSWAKVTTINITKDVIVVKPGITNYHQREVAKTSGQF